MIYKFLGAKDHVHEAHILIGAVLAALDDEYAVVDRVAERVLALHSVDVAESETDGRRDHRIVANVVLVVGFCLMCEKTV